MIPNKLQIKVFASGTDTAFLSRVVPIFHRWITERALGELLVDVADYRHAYQGPGLTLIGHESVYHLDERAGRLGLVCDRRRGFAPGVDPLLDVLRRGLTACSLLERELSLTDKLFDAGSLELSVTDRLATPIPDLTGLVRGKLSPFYAPSPVVELVPESSLQTARVRSSQAVTVSSVLSHLQNAHSLAS